MCDCMAQIEKQIKASPIKELKGRAVTKVEWEFPETAWIGAELEETFVAVAKVYPEGQKRALRVPVQLYFCPFCGKKYQVAP